MVYVDRMRRTLTGRTGDWLARNSFPRTVVLASYAVGGLIAYQATVSLQLLGVDSMTIRMIGAFAFAWLTYLCVIALWLRCMPSLDSQALLAEATGNIQTQRPGDSDDEWLEHAIRAAEHQIRRDARSTFALLLGVAILGILFLLTHWMLHARWYLAELMVDAGKIQHRSIRAVSSDEWIFAPVRQSYWLAIGLTAHFALIGMLLTSKLL